MSTEIEPTKTVTIDHTKPLTVSVIVLSVHAANYKIWIRDTASDDWTLAAEGTTEDTVPDTKDIGVRPAGSSLFYWVGAAGPKKMRFKVQHVFQQDGKILKDGVIADEKDPDANGVAEVQRKVVFP
ncbi:MAG TPA: hypothetical protein VL326_27995 [Kofleriaceae bacterium]|nr:hypothetical protein [Kofleriaceae bacterium]